MLTEDIKKILQKLAHHHFLEIVLTGNTAITSALSIFPKDSTILIPEEGGWFHYKKAPLQLGLKIVEVKCDDAKINLTDLREKINSVKPAAFLYQNPGGYFAQQPMEEIYELCRKNKCMVIMDVSGSIGTPLCDGRHADILVGSFGEWKLVEAKVGGFLSCKDEKIWRRVNSAVNILADEKSLKVIHHHLLHLSPRIKYLQKIRQDVLQDLSSFSVFHPQDTGFVVVVKYADEKEKKAIIHYCTHKKYHYTQCPRYIRINKPAISIELKREQE